MNLPAAMLADDESVLLTAAEASLGIVQALDFNVQACPATGRLREILPEHRAAPLNVFALRAAGGGHGKLRAFIDEIVRLSSLMSRSGI